MRKLASLAVVASLALTGLIAPALTAHAAGADPSTTTTATTTTATSAATETLQQRVEAFMALHPATEEEKAKIRALVAQLPADTLDRVEELNAKLGIRDTQAAEIADNVINPADYQCQQTPLGDWLNSTVAGMPLIELIILAFTPAPLFPTYDALFFGTESKANRFGVNGEYTNLLTSQMKDLRGFWDVNGSDIQLTPMHGADVFKDVNRLARVIRAMFGGTAEAALETAKVYLQLMNAAPGLQHGAHPYFTFNAFAFDPSDEPELLAMGLTKKIVMGDGVLQGYAAIGIDSKVAPRAILAHEYGHQVQYAKDLFQTTLTGPEATRRTELMADAFGSYFMVHSQGEALNKARQLADQKTFYNVGDCGFTSASHHGTPNQRYNTAAWAIGIANSAVDQGHKLLVLPFTAKFEVKLPELVAPDAN
ncbi:hypothetical protein OG394_10415 [Kribbella sp. NBC_01245]|uniref:hypothetical protein n=1 Tax=Kribbella sp. NBC_01245 TaxID=2903578 RepID=UPI002E283B3A|nr:hypothetical protein [Kribbella sp. NBC_01245]